MDSPDCWLMWPGLQAAGYRTLGGPRASGGSLVAGSGSRIFQGLVTNYWHNWVLKSGLSGPGIPGRGQITGGVGGTASCHIGYEAVEKLVLACCPRKPLACCGWAV